MASDSRKQRFSISGLTNKLRRVSITSHPKPDPAATMEISRFMTLPREIRDNIYDYAFPSHLTPSLDDMHEVLKEAQPAFKFKHNPSQKHLIAQVHNEARERFLNRTTVALEFHCLLINHSFENIGSTKLYELLNQARHLEVRIEGLNICTPWRSNTHLEGLQQPMRILRECKNLQTLTLGAWLQTHKLAETKKALEILRDACWTVRDSLGEKIKFSVTSPFPLEDFPTMSSAGCWRQWSGSLPELEKLIARLETEQAG